MGVRMNEIILTTHVISISNTTNSSIKLIYLAMRV